MSESKVDGLGKQYIIDNWYKQSIRAIAERLHVSQTAVREWGKKLGLGRKPIIHSSRSTRDSIAGKGAMPVEPSALDFAGMIRHFFDSLTAKRAELLAELDQLHKLPADDTGRLELKVNGLESQLTRVEAKLIDFEDLQLELAELDESTTADLDEPTTFEQLITKLNRDDMRKKHGLMTGKMLLGAEKIKNEWETEYTEYANGELDLVMLTPEAVLQRDSERERDDHES